MLSFLKENFQVAASHWMKELTKKDALSFATSITHNHNKSLLEINIKTGRKHQIKKVFK